MELLIKRARKNMGKEDIAKTAVLMTDNSDLIYSVYGTDLTKRQRYRFGCEGGGTVAGAFIGRLIGGPITQPRNMAVGKIVGGLLGTVVFALIDTFLGF